MANTSATSRLRKHARKLRPSEIAVGVVGDFVPLDVLWSDDAPKRVFPSETSARWFFRNHREELVKARAICKHLGRILANPPRVEQVAEAVAIAAANSERM